MASRPWKGVYPRDGGCATGRGRLFAAADPASTIIPMKPRGKLFALSTAAVGLVVLVAAGIAAKDRIREEWYLRNLRFGDDHEKLYAAEKIESLLDC